MILDAESWMNIRRFRALHEAGASYAEIARECGVDWRTVRKYLAEDGVALPPRGPSRAGCQPRVITPFVEVIDAWLRKDITLKGSVIHERLVAEHGFTGNYQRVKVHLVEARPRIAAELAAVDENPLSGLHRRFEVVPGAQAQVDWGDEGDILAHVGIRNVYSFHMTLSHSRDPFSCFVTSMDIATFFDCHRRAFAHFGGVPGAIVYDRTKTVVKRHVAPGAAVPIHPEAAAFAGHYDFVIDVLAAYRPTGKDRVSHCTPSGRFAARWFGLGSGGESASLVRRWRVLVLGRVVEHLVLVVVALAADDSGVLPGLHGLGVDAEPVGGLGEGEQPGVAQPVAAVG